MLEIIILIAGILLAFIIVGWVSHHRSQQRAKAFERELDMGESDAQSDFHQRFDAVFQKEQQLQGSAFSATVADNDDEPVVILSDPAQQSLRSATTVAKQKEQQLQGSAFSATVADNDDEPVVILSDPAQQSLRSATTVAKQKDQRQTDSTQAKLSPKGGADSHDWDMVIAFTVIAPASSQFNGRDIRNVLAEHDLHFGDMRIYHRYTNDSLKQTLFSIANIIDPGTLIPEQMMTMKTPGLLIFARLPGPINGLELFDELLDAAHAITLALGGILCDDQRQPLAEPALEAMRNRIFDYNYAMQQQDSGRR